jgi:hypothetical protein
MAVAGKSARLVVDQTVHHNRINRPSFSDVAVKLPYVERRGQTNLSLLFDAARNNIVLCPELKQAVRFRAANARLRTPRLAPHIS